jgi:hypothetical protein
MYVQVVWDEWDDVSNEERGRIIMDAYEQARPDDLLRITMALGLTTADAISRLKPSCGAMPRASAISGICTYRWATMPPSGTTRRRSRGVSTNGTKPGNGFSTNKNDKGHTIN